MSVASLRIVRLFLWGILAVMLLTIGTMYLLRATLAAKSGVKPAVVQDEKRDLAPKGDAPTFRLTAQDGSSFDSSSLLGKVSVVDFFFTKCDGICPVLQRNMKAVQDAFAGNRRVHLLSISVDPKSDTPEVLSKMAEEVGADHGQWTWTVGSTEATGKVAQGYMLVGTEVPGEILHSNRFVLVDGYGRIRAFYNGTDDADVASLIKDVERLLDE